MRLEVRRVGLEAAPSEQRGFSEQHGFWGRLCIQRRGGTFLKGSIKDRGGKAREEH